MASDRKKSKVDLQIDENLKRVYDDVAKEAVPDRFLDLIQQLKKSGSTQQAEKKDDYDA